MGTRLLYRSHRHHFRLFIDIYAIGASPVYAILLRGAARRHRCARRRLPLCARGGVRSGAACGYARRGPQRGKAAGGVWVWEGARTWGGGGLPFRPTIRDCFYENENEATMQNVSQGSVG